MANNTSYSDTTLSSGRTTVTTGGTAVQLASSGVASRVAITAETDNTGYIVVGDSGVVASLSTRKGIPLNAGDTVTLNDVALSTVYIDATVNTDGVTYAAQLK